MNRTITRAELIENISASLKTWTKCPLTCTALLGTIENMVYSEFITNYTTAGRQKGFEEVESREWLTRRVEAVKPYVYSAMMRVGGVFIDCEPRGDSSEYCSKFISSLESSLLQYNISNPEYLVLVPAILSAIRDLIRANSAHASIPTHIVLEQIELLGQYAILSHRWERPVDQELYFSDIEERFDAQSGQGEKDESQHFQPSSHPNITNEVATARTSSEQAPGPSLPSRREASRKKGWEKLEGFRTVAESRYGCRYLWMDTVCIREADRIESIYRMFGWYRRAYVCVVHLRTPASTSTSTAKTPPAANSMSNHTGITSVRRSSWWARGWTLQEFLAPSRMECFADDWTPLDNIDPHSKSRSRLDTLRQIILTSNIGVTPGHDWQKHAVYEPGIHQALFLFHHMRYRDTALPEDRVYCLFSALDISIPVEYGEGFDHAFYRLQVECLTRTHDRQLLIWNYSCSISTASTLNVKSNGSSPYNSMLAADYSMYCDQAIHQCLSHRHVEHFQYTPPRYIPDPSISFYPNGVMRIMLSLHPWPPTSITTAITDSPLSSTSTLVTTTKPYNQGGDDDKVVFASLGMQSFTGDHYGVLLRPIPPKNLERVGRPGKCLASEGVAKGGEKVSLGSATPIYERVIYERIRFIRCDASSISAGHLKEPQWVYLK